MTGVQTCALPISKPWINNIIGAIENDEVFKAQLYNNLRLDFTNYWIQKTSTDKDGSNKYSSISINTTESTRYLLDTWRNNQRKGFILTENSIFNSNGEIDENSSKHAKTLTTQLDKVLTNLRSAAEKEKSSDNTNGQLNILNNNREIIEDCFRAIGVDMDWDLLKLALEQKSNEYKNDNNNINGLNALG